MPGTAYPTVICRGYTAINDWIIDFLADRVWGRYVDIGCNCGFLLSEVPGGIGVDLSEPMVREALKRHVPAVLGRAEALPFPDRVFDTAVLSCVLEQTERPDLVISEALRVARRVIGINPIPGASQWGAKGGWIRSVLPEAMMHAAGFRTERMDAERYFFERAS